MILSHSHSNPFNYNFELTHSIIKIFKTPKCSQLPKTKLSTNLAVNKKSCKFELNSSKDNNTLTYKDVTPLFDHSSAQNSPRLILNCYSPLNLPWMPATKSPSRKKYSKTKKFKGKSTTKSKSLKNSRKNINNYKQIWRFLSKKSKKEIKKWYKYGHKSLTIPKTPNKLF